MRQAGMMPLNHFLGMRRPAFTWSLRDRTLNVAAASVRHLLITRCGPGLRILWILFLCAFFSFSRSIACAVSSESSTTDPNYIRVDFTSDDGLPDNVINAITQTQNGLLWLATDTSLTSFDGATFRSVKLRIPGSPDLGAVSSLAVGQDGDLWVGTYAGIVRIPKQDLHDPFLTDSTVFHLDKQGKAAVYALFSAHDGTIWAGTNDGLYRFDGRQFQCVFSTDFISRINETSNGHLVLVTSHGVADFDGKNLVRPTGIGAQLRVRADQIFDVHQEPDGSIWYATAEGIRKIEHQHVISLGPGKAAHAKTYRIFAYPDGALWVSTSIGMYKIAGGDMWSPVPGLEARSFFVGRDGDLWIGTNGSGLVRLQRRTVQMFTKAEGLPSDIAMTVLPTHDGRIWVGMNCGFAVLEGTQIRAFHGKDGLADTCVWALAEDHDHSIWLGTYSGRLFRYRDGVFTQYTMKQGLSGGAITKIAVADDDSLWLATTGGLSHFKNGNIRNYTEADGLSSSSVVDVHQDGDGTIWAATQGGVDRLASDRFVPLPTSNDMNGRLAYRFFEDSKANLYVADLPGGISRITREQMTIFNRELNVLEMKETKDHRMWFSSGKGVMGFSEDTFARAGQSGPPLDYELFTRADGLNTTEASVGSPNISVGMDGRLWIATVKGLAMIDTSRIPRTGRRPPIFVSEASTDGEGHFIGNELVLLPGIHHVELGLAVVDLANPQRIRVQYRLEGVDSQWLNAAPSHVAIYTNVPVGSHRLLIRATDSIGHWTPPEAVYELKQLPHFYETLLFRISAATGAVLLLILIYLWRIRYLINQSRLILEERLEERVRIARELHDTLLQSVQGLILRFQAISDQMTKEDSRREMMEQVLDRADEVMLEGRRRVRGLRSEEPDVELSEALALYARELVQDHTVDVSVNAVGTPLKLNAIVREEALRIGREALANALQHSRASRIEAEIIYENANMHIRIRDNGRGIDAEMLNGGRPGHWGIPGMRERAKKIGAQLNIWSSPRAGTEIELVISAAVAYRRSLSKRRGYWLKRIVGRET
jgi:signal transduction histidine kinase/ligand-binding sensor domain-containing protein